MNELGLISITVQQPLELFEWLRVVFYPEIHQSIVEPSRGNGFPHPQSGGLALAVIARREKLSAIIHESLLCCATHY